MKSKVLSRPMFKKNGGPVFDVENVGIMQGFKDGLDETMPIEPDEMEMALGRMPDSPEILMNNLRGDMRSVDARVEELADLVGFDVAMETPTEVLALLQPVLAGQQAPMPPAAPPEMPEMPPEMPPGPEMMPPDMGMMPPGMPPGMPPEAAGGIGALMPPQAPIQMRDGGYVQRFSEGSDEEGVRPAGFAYPPEMMQTAQQNIMAYLSQQPVATPSLRAAVDERVPLYKEIMGGGDRNMTQAQILFDIAQGGLNLAAGTDAEGRPLRGAQSPVSRFASAFSKVPGQIGARVGELEKEERQIKLAALGAAEKDIAATREQNAKLVETQRKMFTDIVKSSGTSVWGKGDWEWAVVNRPGLLARSLQGKTNEQEENQIQSAIAEFQTPIIETRVDPVTREPYTVERKRPIPSFLSDYMKGKSQPGVPAAQVSSGPSVVQPAPSGAAAIAPGAGPAAQPAVTGQAPAAVVGPDGILPPMQVGLYGNAAKVAGPGAAMARMISGVPGLGDPFPEVTQAVKMGQIAAEELIEASMKSRTGAINEQNRLRSIFGLGPRPFTDPELYKSEIVAIDNILAERLKKEQADAFDPTLPPDVKGNAREMTNKIVALRSLFALPPRIYSADDEVYKNLTPGQEYLWQGVYPMKKGAARGK